MPTVTLATDQFAPLARLQARAAGYPDLRVVIVKHPLGGIAPADAAAKADDPAGLIPEILTGSSA